jgi:hypothetical protein
MLYRIKSEEKGMSESMAVEEIVEAYWLLKGFWTKLRFPLRTEKGSWSDIDILCYNPETRELVISESKVCGPKKAIYAFTKEKQEQEGNILKYDDNHYFSFLRHIKLACKNNVIFADFEKMVSKLIVQLVSNYFISKEISADAEKAVLMRVRKDVPANVKLEVKLESTLDVISSIIELENTNPQGRRYGHPVLDMARELNRYMHPKILDAGKGKAAADIKKELIKKLSDALPVEKVLSSSIFKT